MKRILVSFLLIVPVIAFAQDKGGAPMPTTGNVTLALEEYNRLLELAARPLKGEEAPPVPYVIKRADVKVQAANESVLGAVRLEGEVLAKGETKVVLANGMTVLAARQDGRNVPLEKEGAAHTAILRGPAEFGVTLDAGWPLSLEAGRASFNFPVPIAGSVRLSLVVPGDHSNVRLSAGLITARTSEHGQTTVEATLVPGQLTNISWATREIAAPVTPREVRFLSDVKTLISVSDADVRLAVLADVTVVQGEPSQFAVELPPGYELTGVTGASVDSTESQPGQLIIKVTGAAQRSHEFLISLERSLSSPKAEPPFLTFKGSQRETGEVLVEGAATIELTAKEHGTLKRMDFKETNTYLRSLARFPLQAAFRYHRQPSEAPTLALEWTRFADSGVLSAVAERAVATTLVTSEGRSLTEIELTVKNQAQPFLKVDLPGGASILSAEVGGEKVKPVEAPDGNRVPLLRAGFHPNGAYKVSFVFLHSGAPFAKKGGSELALPKMDVPISVLNWEVFLPERYKVKDFGGDVIAANLLSRKLASGTVDTNYESFGAPSVANLRLEALLPGQLGGFVVDPSGAVIPKASVKVLHVQTGTTLNAITDESGRWAVSDVPSGPLKIIAIASGFQTTVRELNYDASSPWSYSFPLQVAAATEIVTVTAGGYDRSESQRIERDLKKNAALAETAASANVLNLQRRVSGVLPIHVDVPRTGNSYRFVRPLVVSEETKVTFAYKSK
jgi:Carboxypeptidase regulatory-like domain